MAKSRPRAVVGTTPTTDATSRTLAWLSEKCDPLTWRLRAHLFIDE